MVSDKQIEQMTDEHFNNNLCDVNDLLAMSVKLQLENNRKLNKIVDNISDSFGLVEGNIVGIEGITIDEGETNSKIDVAINGKIYNCIVKDNVGKHERVVVIGGLTEQPIVSPIKRNRAGEVCGILTENCIVGVKGIALGVATNGNPVSVRIGNKAYSCLAKSDITEYEEVVIVGGTISEPYVFATNTTIEGVTAKNDPATEKPLLDGMEYEALGALTTDADIAGDKVPVKGSAKGVQYVVPTDSDGEAEAAIDPANTARTTATVVQAVQEVDATGKVSPAGEAVGNSPFTKLTDGTNVGAIDPANTARTTATVVQAVQHVGANGSPLPSGVSGDPVYVDVNNDAEMATTPTVYNVVMTLADTEYSQVLPANTKIVEFRCQESGFDTRFAYETAKVATPTAPYRTLLAGEVKTVEGLNLTSKTLYFACGTAAKTMEIECWV